MKHLKKIFVFLLIISCTTVVYAAPKSGRLCKQHVCQYTARYNKIYEKMKSDMINAPVTGNATEDFLSEMIPHHEAAIQMSKNILNYTDNSTIKTLAKNIIEKQTKDVKQMSTLLQQLKRDPSIPKDNDEKYIKQYNQILTTMLTAMDKKSPSHNVNVLFLEEMIPHHAGAIAMADNILKYTTNPKVKKIATGIVESQKTQLGEMEALLKSLNQ